MTIVTQKVLLVDDCQKDREINQNYLLSDKQHNYSILEASTGEEAFLLCRQQFPDVIVMDYLLPDIDGLTFLKNLKTQFGKTFLPVIILTNRGNEQIAVQVMKGGAADYLVKKNTTQLNFIKAVEAVIEKTRWTGQAHEELERRVQQQNTELQEANQELQVTLEELQVAQEELQQQNQELAVSRQALEVERQHYLDLFNFAPDGYLVTDIWGNIREANRTAATLLSIKQQRLIGKPLVMFIAKSDRKAFRTRFAQLPEVQDWEVHLKPCFAEPVPAMLAVTSIYDAQGQLHGWRWLLRDISIRKQMEQRLQAAHDFLEKRVEERTASLEQANAELEELYHHAPCGYHSLDKDGVFIRINDTELYMLGYSREKVLGHKFSDLLTPNSVPTFESNFSRFQERGWVKDLEFEMICKDGSILPISLSATTVQDAAGNFLFSRSVVVDITERKQAEEKIGEQAAF